MFKVRNPAYAGYGHISYGPTFDGFVTDKVSEKNVCDYHTKLDNEFDLLTFTGVIRKSVDLSVWNHSSECFRLNGNVSLLPSEPQLSVPYYKNLKMAKGERKNMISLDVQEMEVYATKELGERKILEMPWRVPPNWDIKTFQTLKEYITTFKPLKESKVPEINILLIGQVGSGKSSFFNTINSIFRGEITARTCAGSAAHSLTTNFRKYRIRDPTNDSYLSLRLCDTRGIEEGLGVRKEDARFILDGKLPDHYQFNPAVDATQKTPGSKQQPKLAEKIHCVASVIDASSIDILPESTLQTFKELQQLVVERGLPNVVYLTKLDKICQTVDADLRNVFISGQCKTAVDKAADIIGVPRSHGFPVKNYEKESTVSVPINILALKTLRQTLIFSNDFLEEQLDISHEEQLSSLIVKTVNK